MPVRVVSDKPVKTKRVTCPTCCYELEFTGEDVTTTYDDFTYQTIHCPRLPCKQDTISVKWP